MSVACAMACLQYAPCNKRGATTLIKRSQLDRYQRVGALQDTDAQVGNGTTGDFEILKDGVCGKGQRAKVVFTLVKR
jgi:hypothetical protein